MKKNLALRILLPAAAVVTFCTRYLTYTFPGPDQIRPVLNATLLDHAATIVQAGLLMLAALGLGSFLLRRLRAEGSALAAAGLGLGAISLAVLLLGSVGLMDSAFLALLTLLPVVFADGIASELGTVGRSVWSFLAERRIVPCLIILAAAVAFVLNIVRAFIPPLAYDTLEYHLGAPAQYLHDGGVGFLPRNVYAAMPANVEMLYLFALGLKGSLLRGAALANLICVVLGLLAAIAAGRLAHKLSGSPVAGLVAAAGFYVFPWTSFLSIRAYVEPGMIFFAVLSLCGFADYASVGQRRSLALAGIFAGLCAGCKYPGVLFLAAPMAVAAFAMHAARNQWRRAFSRAGLVAATVLLVLSPWLIRNLAATGNPTYPLLYSVFGAKTWSPEQDAKWTSAHRAKEFGLASLLGSTRAFLASPERTGSAYLWLPVLLGIVLAPREAKWAWLLVAYVAVCLVLWYLFTQRIARFFAPWAMIAISFAAYSVVRRTGWRRGVAYGFAFTAVLWWLGFCFRDRSPDRRPVKIGQALEAELFNALAFFDEHAVLSKLTEGATFDYPSIRAINALPAGARVLMIGEARTFYCETDVVAATVFDVNPLVDICNSAADARETRDRLAADGITHIYVNLPEIRRLRWSYEYRFQGRTRPGYWDLSEDGSRVFAAFMKSHCELVESFGGPMPLASLKQGRDRGLFRAFAGGRVVRYGGEVCLPFQHALYRLR